MRSFATEQIPELFVINGQEYEINSYPLEALYGYEEIILMLDNNMRCSANWRGYRGVWELVDKELTLNSLVNGACDANAPSVNPEYFLEKNHSQLSSSGSAAKLKLEHQNEFLFQK
ncbi:hypothetical protein [Alteromonas sp. KC14]|uniref:hypothetical protein n=1 Tax=Alteromonas sp. KC14 TaxID=2795689 RepID=UPI0019236D5E|nr:hypothetical protein [Alteromonas sp. KC14]